MLKKILISGSALLLLGSPAVAENYGQPVTFGSGGSSVCSDEDCESGHCCGNYNPLSLMGAQHRTKGSWSASYRFMHSKHSGLLSQKEEVTEARALLFHPVVPRELTVNTHMFDVAYGASDAITINAQIPYLSKKMVITDGASVGTESTSGIGDINLGATYYLPLEEAGDLHLNLNLVLPTGSLDQKVTIAGVMEDHYYDMQMGSGTWGINPRVTWSKGLGDKWRIGAQTGYLMRLGENSLNYSLGNEWDSSLFTSFEVSDGFALNGRLRYLDIGSIKGFNPNVSHLNDMNYDVRNSGGHNLDLSLGATLVGKAGSGLEGHRLGIEFALPLSQSRNRVQLKKDFDLNLGWQFKF